MPQQQWEERSPSKSEYLIFKDTYDFSYVLNARCCGRAGRAKTILFVRLYVELVVMCVGNDPNICLSRDHQCDGTKQELVRDEYASSVYENENVYNGLTQKSYQFLLQFQFKLTETSLTLQNHLSASWPGNRYRVRGEFDEIKLATERKIVPVEIKQSEEKLRQRVQVLTQICRWHTISELVATAQTHQCCSEYSNTR